MIISMKHGNNYVNTLLGRKTLTQRINLPAYMKVGKVEAIVPKRASPAWWISSGLAVPSIVTEPREEWRRMMADPSEYIDIPTFNEFKRYLLKHDYVQAKIKILDYQHIELGDMSEQDAMDEGCESVAAYIRLWNEISPKMEFAFHMNVKIWRIRYELTPQVRAAVLAVGQNAILEAAGMTPELVKVTL